MVYEWIFWHESIHLFYLQIISGTLHKTPCVEKIHPYSAWDSVEKADNVASMPYCFTLNITDKEAWENLWSVINRLFFLSWTFFFCRFQWDPLGTMNMKDSFLQPIHTMDQHFQWYGSFMCLFEIGNWEGGEMGFHVWIPISCLLCLYTIITSGLDSFDVQTIF